MKTKLFGVKKVYVTDEIKLNHPVNNFMDKEIVRDLSVWQELHLTKMGSLQYAFGSTNGVMTCETSLNFSSLDDIDNMTKQLFFLAEDVKGNRMLVGLGKKYMTMPSIEVNDAVNGTASQGCVTEYKVTWNNRAGRIYVE